MKKLTMASVALLAALNVAAQPVLACTAVDFVAADGTVIAGRTMEWALDFEWTVISQPKGSTLTMTAPASLNLPAQKIASKYAVVGVKPGVIPGDTLLEGQNEAGLGMSGNFLPGFTEYQPVTAQDKNYVSILGFGTWALGQFATVDELRKALPGIKVWADSSLPTPVPPTVHFVFTDRSGASIVLEFVKGEQRIYDNVARVITNAPTYDWHLINLRNYLNLSNVGPSAVRTAEGNVTALGQGGGLAGMPGDYTPPSRFVRMAYLRHFATKPKTAAEAIQLTAHALNNVDIPKGVAQSMEGKELVSDYTQWAAIKDLTNNRMMIADYNNRTNFVTLDLNQIFKQTEPASIAVSALPYPKAIDGTKALLK